MMQQEGHLGPWTPALLAATPPYARRLEWLTVYLVARSLLQMEKGKGIDERCQFFSPFLRTWANDERRVLEGGTTMVNRLTKLNPNISSNISLDISLDIS